MMTTLRVEGMTCNHCVNHVTSALRAVEGVQQVEVDLQNASARVEHDSSTALASLLSALEEEGYEGHA